jgi:hypothetical protein
MPLAVIKGNAVQRRKAVAFGDRQASGGIKPAGKKDNRRSL